ncbi:hypothetical protein AKJ57_01160 [candidate division MSBL1 archaeon SCGC-AAA259A05]|uniref:DUF3795 domain-containing protein n=1 Tax=candidate division MSBL1 archaeon SCGC-AAA259A05 TaxID=1698259 RepID=A0A133UB92_9EURY|nr:hypothetical protein AKJ57_01160 [candidate division MSBL1 archaeon SCGC-AAA259A05]
MNEITAFCGLDCAECPAYIAKQEDDDQLRSETAENWSEEHDMDLSPEDINCDGCTADGKLFQYCEECEIRNCAEEKEIENCAHCGEYTCGKLDEIFEAVPGAKNTLDEIHSNLS